MMLINDKKRIKMLRYIRGVVKKERIKQIYEAYFVCFISFKQYNNKTDLIQWL